MKDVYICKACKTTYRIRALERSGQTICKHCGSAIPAKVIKNWRARQPRRIFRLECLCGKTYKIAPPEGDFQFTCKKCGRLLLSISARTLKGIEIPRFIEEAQAKYQAE